MKTCDSCNKELIPVFTDMPMRRRGDFTAQYENALGISFLEGYGMFDDYMDENDVPALVICHDCAHKLIDENPWVAKIVDPRGHSHPEKLCQRRSGHLEAESCGLPYGHEEPHHPRAMIDLDWDPNYIDEDGFYPEGTPTLVASSE